MASLTKNQKANISKIKEGEKYKISDALSLVKECATAKFDESVDVSINLGIDTKKSDQTVRGAVVLPNGTGKVVRVAVFTQGDNVQKATDAGADIVGMDDLMKTMQDGDLNYDVVIASPEKRPTTLDKTLASLSTQTTIMWVSNLLTLVGVLYADLDFGI